MSDSCAPGADDKNHNLSVPDDNAAKVLCNRCDNNCNANTNNEFFGDEGALKCLDKHGDIAFLEVRNLPNNYLLEPKYRVLCSNGSLAQNTSLQVDEGCALSVTIDSEVFFYA